MIPPLTNIQLSTLLEHDALLAGTIIRPYDQIPPRVDYPSSYIFNMDKSDEQGTHWLSIYFDSARHCQYFCPVGTQPFGALYDFIVENSQSALYNKTTLQDPRSALCGYYCIYHLVHATRGYSLLEVVNRFSPRDWRKNDQKVFEFVTTWTQRILDLG